MRPGAVVNSVIRPAGFEIRRIPPTPAADGGPDLAVYRDRYAPDAKFYCIGSGWWSHPRWLNVDVPSEWYSPVHDTAGIDVPWDIATGEPVNIETASAEAIFCSHTTEHIRDQDARHMFREAHRILKPGGFFRLTCPNILLYYEAYRRRDRWLALDPNTDHRFSIQDMFLNEFASQFSNMMRYGNPDGASAKSFTDEEFDQIFASRPLDEALNFFTHQIDYTLQRKVMGAHINWWHFDKFKRFLEDAEFSNVRLSGYGQSLCPAMRDIKSFDTTHPRFSIYVEVER